MIHLPVVAVVIATAAVTALVRNIVDDAYDAGKQQLHEQNATAGAQ
jgi:hypothetical protein